MKKVWILASLGLLASCGGGSGVGGDVKRVLLFKR